MLTLEQAVALYPPPWPLEQLQKEDIHKSAHYGRALLDLPVGYGKTAIGTYASIMLEPDVVVILMPPILLVQWCLWLRQLNVGEVLDYQGSPRERTNMELRGPKWICVSYGIFKNDFSRFQTELKRAKVLTIVDEAQVVKNSSSVIFKAVRDFSLGESLLLMTGTPLSSPADAYAYIKLLNPRVYRTKGQFENVHVKERDFFGGVSEWQHLDLMQSNLALSRVYRSKQEVHTALPKARIIPLYYDLDPAHMALYKRLMEEQLLELEASGGKIDATTAQNLYHCAQQIILNYGYFADDESKVSNFFKLLDEVCEEVDLLNPAASKLIVWTNYKMSTKRVHEHLASYKAVAAYSGADSQKSVKMFLEDPSTRVLAANPKSAGVGLNPAHLCWECIFGETPTRTTEFVQSSGRIDRKGQRFNPNIRIAIARGTIQERLHANLLKNDDLVTQVSGSADSIRKAIYAK